MKPSILRGYVKSLDHAGVKAVGDFADNDKVGLPSEMIDKAKAPNVGQRLRFA